MGLWRALDFAPGVAYSPRPRRECVSPRPGQREFCSVRLRLASQLLATGALASALAACAQRPVEAPAPLPPNPYGYLKPAAVCQAPTPKLPMTGQATASMRLSADGGFCAFHFSQPGNLPFAAGLVIHVPQHGQPLIYNYNGATVVSYTPSAGYIGPDSMTLELVPAAGQRRVVLTLAISVGAAKS